MLAVFHLRNGRQDSDSIFFLYYFFLLNSFLRFELRLIPSEFMHFVNV